VIWGGTGAGYTGPGSVPQFCYEFNYNQAGRVTGKRMTVPFTYQGYISSMLQMESDAAWDNRGRMTSQSIPGDTTWNWAGQRTSLNLYSQMQGTFATKRGRTTA